jgi:hypothetical protein
VNGRLAACCCCKAHEEVNHTEVVTRKITGKECGDENKHEPEGQEVTEYLI